MLEELGGLDPGFRLYGEDIDLCYRAARPGGSAGTSPKPSSGTSGKRETDLRFLTRRTLWHWRGILRFARKHPETLARL